ncbi:unnamed protein product [Discosporangium mesarthrocarpum]
MCLTWLQGPFLLRHEMTEWAVLTCTSPLCQGSKTPSRRQEPTSVEVHPSSPASPFGCNDPNPRPPPVKTAGGRVKHPLCLQTEVHNPKRSTVYHTSRSIPHSIYRRALAWYQAHKPLYSTIYSIQYSILCSMCTGCVALGVRVKVGTLPPAAGTCGCVPGVALQKNTYSSVWVLGWGLSQG